MSKFKIAFLSVFVTLIVVSGVFGYFYINKYQITIVSHQNDSLSTSGNNIALTSFQQRQDSNAAITEGRNTVITRTVKEVSSAVVGINVTEIQQFRDPWANDPFFRYFYGDRVYSRKIKGLGSGTIISPDGYIITNDHVAGNAEEIIVTMTDGTQYDARIVGTDQATDVCLIKIEADHDLPFLRLGNSDDILIGEWVIALGNPFGLFELNDKPTVTVGVISATGMNLGNVSERYYVSMIQTDAAINGGNSGGPLVNSIGEIIGMNTLIYTAQGSSGNVGVGFAIPINKVKNIVTELRKNGKIERDFWTGLRIQSIDEGIADYYKLNNTRGVIITNVENNSPADKAGLNEEDIILYVNNYPINDYDTLVGVLQEFRTGDKVKIELLRNNERLTKYMKLESRK